MDAAKEAADIVLLEKDLGVPVQGVREGRTTFANTKKYVFMATSANFGNMFSLAGATLFLPFLTFLPVATLVLPFAPVARLFDFRPLTIPFVILLGGIVALYIIATEISKKLYYGKA